MTKINPNSIISFSDENSLILSSKNGQGINPIKRTVERILTITEENNLAQWIVSYFSDNFIYIQKIVDKNVDHYLLKLLEHPILNRQQNIDKENFWLFQEPSSENFVPNDLKYTMELEETEDDGTVINYVQKDQGECYGKGIEVPYRTGISDIICAVVEYVSENKQLILLEIGEIDNNNGGAIALYSGHLISSHEVSILS